MEEAELRHRQIMSGIMSQVKASYEQSLENTRRQYEQSLKEMEEKHGNIRKELQNQFMAQMNEVVGHRSAAVEQMEEYKNELERVKASCDDKVTSTMAYGDAQHQSAITRLREELHAEYQTVIDETIAQAHKELQGVRQHSQDQLAKMISSYESRLNESAEQNAMLQESVDKLTLQAQYLGATARTVPHTPANAPDGTEGPKPAPSGGNTVPAGAKELAQAAAEKLQTLFHDTEPAQASAAQPPKERMLPGGPMLPEVRHMETPMYSADASPVRTPGAPGKHKHESEQKGVSSDQLAEIIKNLTQRDGEESKPKAKEAETIKLNDMPTPETYRLWKNHVKDEVKSCSDKPDEAWAWLNEVYDSKDDSRLALEQRLQNPGKFVTLDTKLCAALTRSAKSDLATRILNFKEEKAKVGIQVRGRTILLMFDDYFKTSEEAGNLYRVEDLLNVIKVGDSIQDLKRFVKKWDATIAGMREPPEDYILRDILLRQIRSSLLLKYDIEVFDRAREGDKQKTYAFLLQSIKDLIDRERLRENRNRIVERNKVKDGKEKPAAPAAGSKGGGRGRSVSPGRSKERAPSAKEKICFKFQEGKCDKGKDCSYKHAKAKERSGTPKGKKGGGKGGNKPSMTKEEMAKTPCTYFQQGNCKRGDKCYFKHEGKAAAAGDKRLNSPAPKPKGKPKAKAAPCIPKGFALIAMNNNNPVFSLPAPKHDNIHAPPLKSVRFSGKVRIRKIKAVGEQNHIRYPPRYYDTVYARSEDVPASTPSDIHVSRVAARQLQEVVKAMNSDLVCKCSYLCGDETGSSLTRKQCRSLIGPKSGIVNSVIPTTAIEAQKGSIIWLIDSGSETDLLSESMLNKAGATGRRNSETPLSLITANGSTNAEEVVDVHIRALPEPCSPYVLDQTPAVLSVGVRCMEQGYIFVWPAHGSPPILIRPDRKIVQLKVEGHVPVLDDECSVMTFKQYKNQHLLKELMAMAGMRPSPDDVERGENGVDEGSPDTEEDRHIRSRKTADLMEEVKTLQHQYTHFPKNPYCRTCQKARMMAPQARSRGGQARVDTRRFGDHLIADHVMLKANVEGGYRGEVVALAIKDLHTQFRHVYPSISKSAGDSVQAINHFVGPKDDVEVIYTDNSRELISAIQELGYRHQTSIEYVDSSKSFIEREIRQMLEGSRTNLVQSGLPLKMWPHAIQMQSSIFQPLSTRAHS